jgi:8-oxo-dGTP pyrophosphatase MutT (NUDIX family)
MALPGGRMDPHDADLRATATRETLEEIGLDLTVHATLVGALPMIDTRLHGLEHALAIAPFVFAVSGDPAIHAGPEVADVLWAPVSELVSGSVDTQVRFERAGVELELPGWKVQGRVVWGLTYRMLSTLFRAAGWLRS